MINLLYFCGLGPENWIDPLVTTETTRACSPPHASRSQRNVVKNATRLVKGASRPAAVAMSATPSSVRWHRFVLFVVAAASTLTLANTARMDTARSFSADAGFNVTVASLGSKLRLSKAADSSQFVFAFPGGGTFSLISEENDEPDDGGSNSAGGGGDDDELMDAPPAIAAEAPSWEKELWSGDQVVSFEGVPLSSLSLQEVVASPLPPAKNFRPGQKYAVPV
jgi:hypothetical protein